MDGLPACATTLVVRLHILLVVFTVLTISSLVTPFPSPSALYLCTRALMQTNKLSLIIRCFL